MKQKTKGKILAIALCMLYFSIGCFFLINFQLYKYEFTALFIIMITMGMILGTITASPFMRNRIRY